MNENILLYYWPTPNGWKITIALEEMDLPYWKRWICPTRFD
jgi:glutathione S-transferase